MKEELSFFPDFFFSVFNRYFVCALCVWSSEDWWELLVSFRRMGSGAGTQVLGLSSKCLSLLSHPPIPLFNETLSSADLKPLCY